MELSYDPDAHAIGFTLTEHAGVQGVQVSPYITVWVDEAGCPVHIEMLGVSQFADAPDCVTVIGVTAHIGQWEAHKQPSSEA